LIENELFNYTPNESGRFTKIHLGKCSGTATDGFDCEFPMRKPVDIPVDTRLPNQGYKKKNQPIVNYTTD
jgi:hypothetical protein